MDADWLEEHGLPLKAELVRLRPESASTPSPDERGREDLARRSQLEGEIAPQDVGWLGAWRHLAARAVQGEPEPDWSEE